MDEVKTAKDILDHHIKPLIEHDQYNDYEQAIAALAAIELHYKGKMLEVIGEDEDWRVAPTVQHHHRISVRNLFRAKLREKVRLNALLGSKGADNA